jgi:hypothetical protein
MHHPMHHARVLRDPILLDRYGGCMKVAVRAVMAAFSIKVFCVAMVLTVTSTLSGQSFYGSIVGMVADADGALVPDATVTVANLGTSQVYTVKTNDAGEFSVVNFIPANYKVEVSKEIRSMDGNSGTQCLGAGSQPEVFQQFLAQARDFSVATRPTAFQPVVVRLFLCPPTFRIFPAMSLRWSGRRSYYRPTRSAFSGGT